MKLYEIKKFPAKVRVLDPEGPPPGGVTPEQNTVYTVYNLDGMYSYCKDENGTVVHLAVWTEVEVLTDS